MEPGWIEYVTALATLGSAIVIAAQAVLTRKTVLVAQSALRESQLARLEAQVPRIFVTTDRYLDEATIRATPAGEALFQTHALEGNEVFKLPRDAHLSLAVSHEFKVRNDGPGSVSVQVPSNVSPASAESDLVIGAGESLIYKVNITETVARWIELSKQKDAATPLQECHRVTVTYRGPRDADVWEHHDIVFRGSLLEEVVNATGDWQVPLFIISVEVAVLPAIRDYWSSQSARTRF